MVEHHYQKYGDSGSSPAPVMISINSFEGHPHEGYFFEGHPFEGHPHEGYFF